jgi:endonuclease/exonuclease/phosphatase family metal-dependent hydrolase
VRLLTYNIRYGGVGRVRLLADVVGDCAPDVVVLQEAHQPTVVKELAAATGMTVWAADPGHSVAFMSRIAIAHHEWHRPRDSRRAYLEIVPAGTEFRIFGLHLSAVHSNWTERRRVRELRAVLAGIQRHQHGFHVLAGDFNTIAPGATLDIRKLPPRLQAVVWLTGRKIRWETIQIMLDASYLDAYRVRHLDDPGFTFPTWDPHVRLDYAFLPQAWASRFSSCEVMDRHPSAAKASDHLPLSIELDLTGGVANPEAPSAGE